MVPQQNHKISKSKENKMGQETWELDLWLSVLPLLVDCFGGTDNMLCPSTVGPQMSLLSLLWISLPGTFGTFTMHPFL